MSKTKTPNLTLTELAELAGVSAPTIIKYKAAGQLAKWIVGEGRTARYKAGVVATLKKLKAAGLAKRGRPKKIEA
jgi:hypothetical protein